MRLPRLRLTVRWLMVLVAVAALVLGGVRSREHYKRCMTLASIYETRMKNQSEILRAQQSYSESLGRLADQSSEYAEFIRRQAAEDKATAEAIRANRPLDQSTFDSFNRMAASALQRAQVEDERVLRAKEQLAHGKREIELNEADLRHLSRLTEKYLRAAFRPWARIPADPPPPSAGAAAAFWLRRGDFGRALAEYDRAIKLDVMSHYMHGDYAWILATCPDQRFRDGKKAIASATQACELTEWRGPMSLDTLAAAYAENGDFAQAVAWQQKAIALLPADSPVRAGYLGRLTLYRAGRPYREEPKGTR